VLLVDDEPENLETLAALLDSKYDVHVAPSASEALRLLASGVSIDLVIADQRMPSVTGVELLARIAVERPDTIRIVLTAYDDVGPMMDAINRGSVFRFLMKPCAPDAIRAAIADGLRIKEGTEILRHFINASIDRQDQLDRTVWELAQTRDHLMAAERLSTMGRAVSGIIHNIRNLATLVSMLVSELQLSARYSDVLAAGKEALEGFDELAKLLESIREFTRIHDTELELTPTDMRILLRQTAAVALLHDGGKNCPIAIEVEPDFDRLMIDRTCVRHALTAALSNALRASESGSPIALRVSAAKAQVPHDDKIGPSRWVSIEVVDAGVGMDPETLKRATEPLFSGFSPPSLGLGLSAARLAATIHGGDLLLQSELGRGTRVSLLLPITPLP
jgi:signal transduction histidine kinase